MSAEFDPQAFEAITARWAAGVLQRRAGELQDEPITGLAIDLHPWHGSTELCLRTAECDAELPELGDWDYYEISQPQPGETPRREFDVANRQLRSAWQTAVKSDPDSAAAIARQAYEACARALGSAQVIAALRAYTLSPDFELFVGDPDDTQQRNFCTPSESQRVRNETQNR